MKLTERTDIRCFSFMSSEGEVNLFISPVTEELLNRGCQGINGYIFNYLTVDDVPVDMDDDDGFELALSILREVVDEDIEEFMESFNGDVCGELVRRCNV